MALKKETLQKIAALTKTKVADLETAIKADGEVDFAIDEGVGTYTEAEITQLKNNEYNNGKTKGVEMAVKDTKEKLGLEFQGKTIDGLVEAANKKALDDAKVNPDAKVKELNEKIATLQNTITTQDKQLQEKEGEVSGIRMETSLLQDMPAGVTLPGKKILGLMKMDGYEFKQENGKTVVYKDGKLMEDKLSNPVVAKDVMAGYVTEQKLGKVEETTPGGRGGGNEGKGAVKYTKLSELKKEFEGGGKSLLGQEFQTAVAEARKADATFDMNA